MTKYHTNQKVYVKSVNSSHTIISRYTYTLIVFTIISLIINAIIGNEIGKTIKSICLSLLFSLLITYIINIVKKEYDIKRIFTKESIISIGLIIGLFTCDSPIILLIAVTIALVIKNISKNINLSASLYGILIIVIYNAYTLSANDLMPLTPLSYINYATSNITFIELLTYGGGVINYLFNIYYLSPLLSVIVFCYLFYKKSIKYNVVIYYILTVFSIILIYGLIKGYVWLTFLELAVNGLIFLSIYALADYKNSPTISEAQILYGIILGIVTVILKFIIPDFAIIVAMILGSLLVKPIDKLSYKLKYNKLFLNVTLITILSLAILTGIGLSFVF